MACYDMTLDGENGTQILVKVLLCTVLQTNGKQLAVFLLEEFQQILDLRECVATPLPIPLM